jgi:hypothetical protein
MNADDNEDEPEGNANVSQLLKILTKEVKEMKESNREVVAALKRLDHIEADIQVMKEENKTCMQIITQQQRYLEILDERDRVKNVIITGVTETVDALGDTDLAKVLNIMGEIDVQGSEDLMEVKRLGKQIEGRTRAMLVSFTDKQVRQNVLKNAKKLKDSAAPYNKVYIKKDIHPMVRKELNRLRKVEQEEKRKPENQGKTIKYDYKERTVTRDGLVIDRFRPSFF